MSKSEKPISEFEKTVNHCYEKKKNTIIHNNSIKHARILVERLFEKAKTEEKDVKILSGALNANFYANFTKVIKGILDKNKVTVITTSPCENSTFKQAIKYSTNGELYSLNNTAIEKIFDFPHFIVVGDDAYRLEESDRLKTATACFNDKQVTAQLSSLHESIVRLKEKPKN